MKTSCNDQSNPNYNRDQLFKIGRRLFLAGVIASTFGCQNMIHRGQSPDEPLNVSKYENNVLKPGPRSIGESCILLGLGDQKVYGIGLATKLKGTGSAPIESGQREHLQRELQLTHDIGTVKDLLSDKNTELVLLEGGIPPGARVGDRFDLRVVTKTESDGTSIENGLVLQSRLRKMAHLGNHVRKGNIAATGGGPVIVKSLVNNTDETADAVHGVIPGGGKATVDRLLSLRIRGDEYNQKTALQIAHALNKRFHYLTSIGPDGVAEPKTDRDIELQVPDIYRNNIGRYALVLSHLIYAEKSSRQKERLTELEAQIGEPAKSKLAAVQLEAIGDKALPILRAALSHNDLEVRFHAAEALAYMDVSEGLSVLVDAAKTVPSYRWHVFAALAAMDSRESANVLSEFFNESEVELRYGAFRAIRQQNADDPIVTGDLLADEFYLLEVDSTAEPVIHFSTHRRSEIVIFGSKASLKNGFLYVESGLTIKSSGEGTISITAYSPDFTKQQRVCSNQVSDFVRTLSELGYGFGSQLKILRQASQNGKLNGEIAINAAPKIDLTSSSQQHVASDYKDIEPESSVKRFINWIKP